MNKRGFILSCLTPVISILSSFSVQAAPFNFDDASRNITGILSSLGKFLFKDLPTMGDFGFKFILWIILFALFYSVLSLPKFGFKKNVSTTIALALSFGSVVVMPHGIIQTIFNLYSTVIVLVLGLLVPIAAYYLAHAYFKGTSRYDHFMCAIIYGIMCYSLIVLVETIIPSLTGL
jgi:hypothetical protein